MRHLVVCFFLITGCSSTDIRKGTVALHLGDYELAEHFFSRCVVKNPASYEGRKGLGMAYLQRASDNRTDTASWRRALLNLEAARTLTSSDEIDNLLSHAWTQRGSMLLSTKDTVSALEAITRALDIHRNNHEALNLAGIIYYKAGSIDKARRLFEKAQTIDTNNVSSAFNLGMLYWEEHRISEARDTWIRALKLAPDDEEVLYWFAAAEKYLQDSSVSGTPNGSNQQK